LSFAVAITSTSKKLLVFRTGLVCSVK